MCDARSRESVEAGPGQPGPLRAEREKPAEPRPRSPEVTVPGGDKPAPRSGWMSVDVGCGRGAAAPSSSPMSSTGSRTDLFERFERDPLARQHDLEVQGARLGVRGLGRAFRGSCWRGVAGGGWLLTEVGARRGEQQRMVVAAPLFGEPAGTRSGSSSRCASRLARRRARPGTGGARTGTAKDPELPKRGRGSRRSPAPAALG